MAQASALQASSETDDEREKAREAGNEPAFFVRLILFPIGNALLGLGQNY
jgi:hypothetical protein